MVQSLRILSFILALLTFTSSLGAQYFERVDVSIANIDVVVRDKDGNLVRGLTRDDFEVYEDGKLQVITNLSAYDARVPVAQSPQDGVTSVTGLPISNQARLVILFVDIQDIDQTSRAAFFQSVRSFLDSALRQGDFATVLTWTKRIRVVLPPTSNRARLDAVIGAFASQGFAPLAETLERVREMQIQQSRADADFANSIGMLPANDPEADAAFAEFSLTEERCALIKRKAREIRNLIAHLTRVELKKVMLFASDEVTLRPNRTCSTAVELTRLANTANAYGITIHGLHPPGQRSKFTSAEKQGFLPRPRDSSPFASEYQRTFDESGGLLLLAQKTGGVMGVGRQSARKLEEAAEELESYYSIGYPLSPGNEDKGRTVKVATKNRSYRTRTRESVVRLSADTRLRDQIATNLYFADHTGSQSPSFTARTVHIKRDGRYLKVGVEVSIRSSDLFLITAASGEKKKGSFSVFVAAGRDLGDASDVTELRQDFERSPDTPDVPMLNYTFEMRIRPDTSRLSLAVRDNNTGEVATTNVELRPTSTRPRVTTNN